MGRTSDAKDRLLDAALELIWERSYGTVTIDAICERAGVKKGSFYYFFDSKSTLAVAALEYSWQELSKAKWDAWFSPSMAPSERVRRFMQEVLDFQADMLEKHGQVLGCPCFSVGSEVCSQDELLRAKAQEILDRQIRYFETTIRDGQAQGEFSPGDPLLMAKSLFALFEGSMGQARIQNDLEYLRNLPEASIGILGGKPA